MNYIDLLKKQIEEGKTILLSLDLDLYSKKTLFRCCYKFTDRLYVYIEKNQNSLSIYLTAKNDSLDLNDIVGEFSNELLDQELRTLVLDDTKTIRDTMVTRALLSGRSNGL
jgi:His-Xaa-Ser system protein HxsD